MASVLALGDDRRVLGAGHVRLVAGCMLGLVLLLAGCTSSGSGSGRGTTAAAHSPSLSATPSAAPATSNAPTASVSAAALAPFVGQWAGHGRTMTISATGAGLAQYRSYIWCTDSPAPDCDRQQGNEIIDGGRVTFRVTSVENAKTARGVVLTSTDPKVRTGPMTLTAGKKTVTASFLSGPFCSLKAKPSEWVCGA